MSIYLRLRCALLQFAVNHGYFFSTSRIPSVSRLGKFLREVAPVAVDKPLLRLGGPGDGGYLVPDDLDGIQACFSPGVSAVANFELAMAERGIPSYLADFSVDGPPIENPLFDFEKKYLGIENDDVYIRLQDWVNRKAPGNGDLILQMDIEGAEYQVLIDTPPEVLNRFRIIVVEMHGLERLFSVSDVNLIELVLRHLLKYFYVVHIHPNNCSYVLSSGGVSIPSVMEFTFLRRDCMNSKGLACQFPHPLDEKNISEYPDIVLPICWRG